LEEEGGNVIIYRTDFYERILDWLDSYRESLKGNADLRRNFVRKFDDLCDIKHDLYFAYASNIDRLQMRERLQDESYVHSAELAELKNHRLLFNKQSKDDNTGKANIKEAIGAKVYGLLYEIDSSGLALMDKHERGYEKRVYRVKRLSDGVCCRSHVYVSPDDREELAPSQEYGEKVLRAMATERFPEDHRLELDKRIKRLRGGKNITENELR
jgi:hypothetical protein